MFVDADKLVKSGKMHRVTSTLSASISLYGLTPSVCLPDTKMESEYGDIYMWSNVQNALNHEDLFTDRIVNIYLRYLGL